MHTYQWVKSMNVKLSVVIPHRNHSSQLLELLSCLESQTLPPNEVIIVDDASDPAEYKNYAKLLKRKIMT